MHTRVCVAPLAPSWLSCGQTQADHWLDLWCEQIERELGQQAHDGLCHARYQLTKAMKCCLHKWRHKVEYFRMSTTGHILKWGCFPSECADTACNQFSSLWVCLYAAAHTATGPSEAAVYATAKEKVNWVTQYAAMYKTSGHVGFTINKICIWSAGHRFNMWHKPAECQILTRWPGLQTDFVKTGT